MEFLRLAANQKCTAVLANSLSVSGMDEAVANILKHDIAVNTNGNAQLTTNTLPGVVTGSTSAVGKSGQRYSVVGIINHPNAGAAKPALDKLLERAVLNE